MEKSDYVHYPPEVLCSFQVTLGFDEEEK